MTAELRGRWQRIREGIAKEIAEQRTEICRTTTDVIFTLQDPSIE
jgi:hypothetical protein